MDDQFVNRVRVLIVWDILMREADERNPMDSTTLLKRLAERGFKCDRRTLYRDVAVMNKYGYAVGRVKNRTNYYYVKERPFNEAELLILMNAVQAASFISTHHTEELTRRIAALAGKKRAEVLRQNTMSFSSGKGDSDEVFAWVSLINEAISKRRKLAFYYFDLDHNGERVFRTDRSGQKRKRYRVSPIATVFYDDKYYLACMDGSRKKISQYRVDKMSDLNVTGEPIGNIETGRDFDAAAYYGQMFGMYDGEPTKVNLYVEKRFFGVLFDKFGKKSVRTVDCDERGATFEVEAQVSPTFYAWCCSLGGALRVLSPKSVADGVRSHLKSVSDNYE